ncbi:hypothetical protein QN277_021050 [Acacia crassicarpa]|uniref:Uncharacterized protein n=1 Tax=Acacia crassicarpa TaxID=499986 RepID=A0AAE1MSP4_9FABA|nr:hypothetical protein QN277_021050 [Acacia crassicarpa]
MANIVVRHPPRPCFNPNLCCYSETNTLALVSNYDLFGKSFITRGDCVRFGISLFPWLELVQASMMVEKNWMGEEDRETQSHVPNFNLEEG